MAGSARLARIRAGLRRRAKGQFAVAVTTFLFFIESACLLFTDDNTNVTRRYDEKKIRR